MKGLLAFHGVGLLTAETFTAVIDDPSRFTHSAEVGPYLGLVAKRWQSGQIDQSGRITKCGDAMLRHLLYARIPPSRLGGGNAPILSWQSLKNRSRSRPGPSSSKPVWVAKKPLGGLLTAAAPQMDRAASWRAIVALARKLAVLMHKLWVSGEAFDPDRVMAA